MTELEKTDKFLREYAEEKAPKQDEEWKKRAYEEKSV